MCAVFQINTEFVINQLKKYFYERDLHSSLISEKLALSIIEVSRIIHFLLVVTIGELYHISNKYWPPNKLAKYWCFYTRDFISHFQKKLVLSILKVFQNFHFFWLFLTVSEVRYTDFIIDHQNNSFYSGVCNNINFLLSQQNSNVFSQKAFYCSFLLLKNCCFPMQWFLETSTFYEIFTFSCGSDE